MFIHFAIRKWSIFVCFNTNLFPSRFSLDILTETGNLKGDSDVYRHEPLSRRAGL